MLRLGEEGCGCAALRIMHELESVVEISQAAISAGTWPGYEFNLHQLFNSASFAEAV